MEKVICFSCKGNGWKQVWIRCPACKGRGYYYITKDGRERGKKPKRKIKR